MRTMRNLRKIGIKEYLHQMQYIGDTKAGTYIATDKYGNKYYENLEQELPRQSISCFSSPSESRQLSIPLSLTVAISTNKMGGLCANRIRPRTDRARVARLDVVYSRQATDGGSGVEDGAEELGDTRA